MIKTILIVLAVVAVVAATVPLWGGCDVNYKVCSTWCEIKHFNADVKEAACKGGCMTEKLGCLAKEAAE